MRRRHLPPWLRPALLLLLVVGGSTVVLSYLGWLGLDPDRMPSLAVTASSKWLFLVVATIYATLCARRLRSLPWGLMAGGIVLYWAAQSVLVYYQLLQRISLPFPSLADPLFLLGMLFLFVGALAFLRELAASGFPLRLKERLPWGLLLVFGLGVPLSVLLLDPVLPLRDPGLEQIVSLLYPVMDLLLLVPLILLLQATRQFRGGQVWRVWSMLLGGFVLFLVGDLLFAVYLETPSPVLGAAMDLGFLGGYAALAFATSAQLEMSL